MNVWEIKKGRDFELRINITGLSVNDYITPQIPAGSATVTFD